MAKSSKTLWPLFLMISSLMVRFVPRRSLHHNWNEKTGVRIFIPVVVVTAELSEPDGFWLNGQLVTQKRICFFFLFWLRQKQNEVRPYWKITFSRHCNRFYLLLVDQALWIFFCFFLRWKGHGQSKQGWRFRQRRVLWVKGHYLP